MASAMRIVDVGMPSTQPEDWRFSTKRAEEKLMANRTNPMAERKIAIAEAAATVEGKPAATAERKMVVAEAGARRTKVVRVKQGYIDYLLAHPPKPYRAMSQDLINKVKQPESREELRALMATVAARHQRMYDQHVDFLEQYHLKGYAEQEIEVGDDDEEDDDEDDMAVAN